VLSFVGTAEGGPDEVTSLSGNADGPSVNRFTIGLEWLHEIKLNVFRSEGDTMLRLLLLGATAAVTMSMTAAMADNKSDCQNGVAMIEAELKKEHGVVFEDALRKALSFVELNVEKQAWSECIKYIEFVRALLTPSLIDRAIKQQSIPGDHHDGHDAGQGNDQAKTSDDQAKASNKERAASDKPTCEQGEYYWCAKRAGCIKTGTRCQYLQGDFAGDRRQ
jgi:hypothetical protein